MKHFIQISIIIIVTITAGCSDENDNITGNNNYTSIRSVNDTLAVGISASNYSNFQNIQLNFSSDTTNLYMSVNGFGSGSGQFRIMRDTNLIFSSDLNSTFTISQRVFSGPPTNAVIDLQNYKGNASILLTR